MGEVVSAVPLITEMKKDSPHAPIFLSTSTAAGRATASKQVTGLVDGIFYCPLDFVSCIRRALRTIRPALVIVLETEIWPNLYAEVKHSGASLAIVNGRISDRTWPTYRRWQGFFRPTLQLPDAVFAQSEQDRKRYAALGVPAGKLAFMGNLKYDASVEPAVISFDTFGAEQIWIAASTVGPNERGSQEKHTVDEDEIVLDAFEALRDQFPKLLLILAPRQPARFDEVAAKLARRGLSHVRRTGTKSGAAVELELPGVLLLDTMGELSGVYSRADVAFVGGSIAPRGGHNILEPAAAGTPVIVGPQMQNFQAIADDFIRANALLQVGSAEELAPAVAHLLRDPRAAERLRSRAISILELHRGASRKIASRLLGLCTCASPRGIHSLFTRSVLSGLAALWRAGGNWKRSSSELHALALPKLDRPVISVGGITVGGSGKTPFTTYLTARLHAQGLSPAILTRGYRRRSPARCLVFAPGSHVPSALTGDEAQIFLRAGIAPLGIGADRHFTARILLREFPSTDVLLLDDGFQHARLPRHFDIVIIDGLDPMGGGNVVPLGRLREPLEALARAHAFVVTRAESDARFEAIRAALHNYNANAPVYRTRLIARCWRDLRGNCVPDVASRSVGAFCGLGNPENFWRTLDSLGLNVVFRWEFPDHHAYKPVELQRVAFQARLRGADLLVATEKDRINCPHQIEASVAPLQLAFLEIELELENEDAFFAQLRESLAGFDRERSPA